MPFIGTKHVHDFPLNPPRSKTHGNAIAKDEGKVWHCKCGQNFVVVREGGGYGCALSWNWRSYAGYADTNG
jgi:hypothetical protein